MRLTVTLSEYDSNEVCKIADERGEDPEDVVDGCLYYLPYMMKNEEGYDYGIELRAKYKTLLNAIFEAARVSQTTGAMYTVDDEKIYAVLQALEPELYETHRKEIEEYGKCKF